MLYSVSAETLLRAPVTWASSSWHAPAAFAAAGSLANRGRLHSVSRFQRRLRAWRAIGANTTSAATGLRCVGFPKA